MIDYLDLMIEFSKIKIVKISMNLSIILIGKLHKQLENFSIKNYFIKLNNQRIHRKNVVKTLHLCIYSFNSSSKVKSVNSHPQNRSYKIENFSFSYTNTQPILLIQCGINIQWWKIGNVWPIFYLKHLNKMKNVNNWSVLLVEIDWMHNF